MENNKTVVIFHCLKKDIKEIKVNKTIAINRKIRLKSK